MMRIITVSMVIALICTLTFTATAKQPINIGVFLPMTGGMAVYGRTEWDGIKTAHQMMTKVLGREVRLFLEDTRSDPAEAVSAVNRLVKEQKVVGIIGGALSASALAGGVVAEELAVPMISPSATNPHLTKDKKYVFRVCFDDSFQGQVAARQAIIGMNTRRAALIVDIAQEAYCVALANLFLKAFVEMGGKVLVTSYIQTGDQDFTNQLSEVLSANPDIIYLPNYYAENALLAKQVRDFGIKVPILMSDGAQVEDLVQIAGKAVEEVHLTGHFNADRITTRLGQEYASEYSKRIGRKLDAFGALGADAYFLFLDAIRRARSTDGPKLSATLANTKNFDGVSGQISMDESGSTVKSLVINKVRSGSFTYVTTVNP
ncbi:MAG: ABC transporter substrate-binding protein [Deltaproteobacteria bacterium]|nr:MAG: ABC transporter substrate-binding protein [Deltaproteobacteria bacterium]